MSSVPRDPAFDSTLALLRDGYDYLWKRHQRLGSDIFVTRFLGRTAVSIHGTEATELFYDASKFQRRGALPRRVVTSLFGKKAIHTLDDAAHLARKTAFLSLMRPNSLEDLMLRVAQEWQSAIQDWERQGVINLFLETQRLLTRAVCGWAGVVLLPAEVNARAAQLGAMVEAFGGVGPRLWQGKLARMQAERWIERLIHDVRRGTQVPTPDCALATMAQLQDHAGRLLPARVAAVELLNVLRPTVAISWYIAFAALALHEHPEAQQKLLAEPVTLAAGEYADLFMHEVRRFYPFTPYLGAKVRERFSWHGHDFTPGTMVFLDVYGSLHDPETWEAPGVFRPERFRRWDGSAYNFAPQGGGDVRTGHRCPGEWITMHNVTIALHFLTRCMTYRVKPGQDLSFDLSRMPTRPKSGFLIEQVSATDQLLAPAPIRPSSAATKGNDKLRAETNVVTLASA